MWNILRIFISLIVSVEIAFSGLFSGVIVKGVEMPEVETGEYTQYVDPFIGTGGTPWTCGMLSPAATVPFGKVRLGPDTSFIGGAYLFKTNTSGYYYEHSHIKGFSHSRLSGTGVEDYGIFRVTPAIGDKKAAAVPYSHKYETATAGYYAVYLQSLGCLAELTTAVHTGVHRYTFDNSEEARLYIDVTSAAGNYSADGGFVEYDEETGVVSGGAVLYAGFSMRDGGLPVYFAASVDREIKEISISGDGKNKGIDLNLGNLRNESVELNLAISFVSRENALLNLETETEGEDFEGVRRNALASWEERLSSISIESDSEEIKKIFYTALYHSMIMPTDFTDVNGEYLGFDKKIYTADGYTYRTDMSLWDTCRNTHSLYTLIAHDVQNDCLNSLVDMAEKGGSFPRWPMGAGYTWSMQGDPANIVISESYLKGFRDFDAEKAYFYMTENSEKAPEKEGRDGIELYNQYGYIPEDLDPDNKSVSKTIEYSWQDDAISKLAKALGKTEEAQKYGQKAMNYRNLFNEETQYFQARNSDGSFVWNFSPYITAYYDAVMIKKFASPYCEGSARQWRWSAIHDVDGMISLFKSEEYFVKELENFMKDTSLTRAALDPGNGFWLGNQHDIHTPYLFSDVGRDDLTEKWVRWALENRFSDDIDGLDGNDDSGTISTWYVFSAIGIYPLAGSDKYWIGSPNVDSAVLTLSNGNTLSITANNQSDKNIYVSKVTLNGEEIKDNYLIHSQLMGGGELVFEMSSKA